MGREVTRVTLLVSLDKRESPMVCTGRRRTRGRQRALFSAMSRDQAKFPVQQMGTVCVTRFSTQYMHVDFSRGIEIVSLYSRIVPQASKERCIFFRIDVDVIPNESGDGKVAELSEPTNGHQDDICLFCHSTIVWLDAEGFSDGNWTYSGNTKFPLIQPLDPGFESQLHAPGDGQFRINKRYLKSYITECNPQTVSGQSRSQTEP